MYHDTKIAAAACVTIRKIQKTVGQCFDISHAEMLCESRRQTFAYPRHLGMYLARKLTRKSWHTIGRSFNRDHSTILHGYQKISRLIHEDETVREEVDALMSWITQREAAP